MLREARPRLAASYDISQIEFFAGSTSLGKVRSGKFMRDCLDRDDAIALCFFALIKFFGCFAMQYREIGSFDICPSQKAIAVFLYFLTYSFMAAALRHQVVCGVEKASS